MELTNKKSTIEAHLKSASHQHALALVKQKQLIQASNEKYFEKLSLEENRNTPITVNAKRLAVVAGLLSAGIPLSKVDTPEFHAILDDGKLGTLGLCRINAVTKFHALLRRQINFTRLHPCCTGERKGSCEAGNSVSSLGRYHFRRSDARC
jgi:hypothetical protein